MADQPRSPVVSNGRPWRPINAATQQQYPLSLRWALQNPIGDQWYDSAPCPKKWTDQAHLAPRPKTLQWVQPVPFRGWSDSATYYKAWTDRVGLMPRPTSLQWVQPVAFRAWTDSATARPKWSVHTVADVNTTPLYSAGTEVGTGEITLGSITVAGTGEVTKVGAGAITLGSVVVAGTGEITHVSTGGAITLGSITVYGVGGGVVIQGQLLTIFLTDVEPVPSPAYFKAGIAHSALGARYVCNWPANNEVVYIAGQAVRPDGAQVILASTDVGDGYQAGFRYSTSRGEMRCSTSAPSFYVAGYGMVTGDMISMSEIS